MEGCAEATEEIKRSVFTCRIKGVESFADGMAFVAETAKRHSDATHNCYAVLCVDGQKCSDDGEPQGTAGQPILQTIVKRGLNNVAAVVTRYFGGIKLGASGLTSSYALVTSEALNNATAVRAVESVTGKVSVEYSAFREVAELIRRMGILERTDFSSGAEAFFAVPTDKREELVENLARLTAGKASPVFGENKIIKYKKS